jgi:hypothetical protein
MTEPLASLRAELRALLGAEQVIDGGDALAGLSKDFFWYSPVLRRQLDGKLAQKLLGELLP